MISFATHTVIAVGALITSLFLGALCVVAAFLVGASLVLDRGVLDFLPMCAATVVVCWGAVGLGRIAAQHALLALSDREAAKSIAA